MSFKASVQLSFSAAHQLKGYKGRPACRGLSGAGRCENMHGHNWKVQVCCKAEKLDKQGMVVDFAVLKNALNKVLMRLDHKVLNDLPYFKKVNPTSENIAKYIYETLNKKLSASDYRLSTISVWETDTSCATYSC